MNWIPILIWALLGLFSLLAATLVFGVVHRFRRDRHERRHEAQIRIVRPVILTLAAGEGEVADELDDVDVDLLEEVAGELLGKLRGEARDELVAVLDSRGAFENARARLTSRRATRRALAVVLLGAAPEREAVTDLIQMLNDPHPDVARAAARSLGKQGDPRAVHALLAVLDGPRALPMGLVAAALLDIGRAGVAELMSDLETAAPIGRAVAAEVLGRVGATEAADVLLQALSDDPEREVRLRAAHALGRLGVPKASFLMTALLQDSDDVVMRAICARGLGEVGGKLAITQLAMAVEEAEHHSIAVNAADALVAVGPKGVAVLNDLATGEGLSATYAAASLARAELATASSRYGGT